MGQGTRFLKLIIPEDSHRPHYIYYQDENDYKVDDDPSIPAIVKRFKWLVGERAMHA